MLAVLKKKKNSPKMKKTVTSKIKRVDGKRSGLEARIASELDSASVTYEYESIRIEYNKPERTAKYTPDFILDNKIIIEAKGRFVTSDRQKHLLIKLQHPEHDIRFVFSNPQQKISKKSKTTYAMWCERHGFKYAKESVPKAWIDE